MTTADVIRIHKHGGPEEMAFESIDLPPPGAGQVRLRQTAIGLNFIDVYTRTGLYPGPTPSVLGVEAAGVIEKKVRANPKSAVPGKAMAERAAKKAARAAEPVEA